MSWPRLVGGLAALAAAVALLLASAQLPFADSRFEYLEYRVYQGAIVERPYPALLTREGPFVLVAPGKHGADGLVEGMGGSGAELRGALIQRGPDRMLELEPGSIRPADLPVDAGPDEDLGPVTLTGEIVDSKCYSGVMNPGQGKVHRDCAVRCLSGGIPPAFLARDAAGRLRAPLLAGPGGRRLNREILDMVAEPVRVRGRLRRSAGLLILEADPAAIERVSTME